MMGTGKTISQTKSEPFPKRGYADRLNAIITVYVTLALEYDTPSRCDISDPRFLPSSVLVAVSVLYRKSS